MNAGLRPSQPPALLRPSVLAIKSIMSMFAVSEGYADYVVCKVCKWGGGGVSDENDG